MKKLIHILITFIILLIFFGIYASLTDPSDNAPDAEKEKIETLQPSAEQANMVQEMLERGVAARNIEALKSKSHNNGYYVGAKLYGKGLDGTFACWFISGTRNNPGMVLSVDVFADEYSVAPKNDQMASMYDDEYDKIKKALK